MKKTLQASIGARMRQKRAVMIKALIELIYGHRGSCRILDVGGETAYWRLFSDDYLRSRRVHITLSILESWSDAVAVDPDLFSMTYGEDGCDLPYPDNAFDLVHSNSVIEHVGDWQRMKRFAAEVRRLAPRYYVQTPYFWFPYEPHFGALVFHWLPESLRIKLLQRRAMGTYPKAESVSKATDWAQSARLLDKAQFATLFSDAHIHREKMAGVTKSLIAIR